MDISLSAGDVNGDGYSDVIIGAVFDNGQTFEGEHLFITDQLQDYP
ncbi:MAG: FG-GAP repeat protein [Ignavibacteria bacterium]|nr:FG-GAP repeat protein [Ignavibacteria bacterium]